jgi:predicted RNA-binding Zn ribbon-like protein
VNRGLLPEGVSLDDADLARARALREAIRLLLLANTGASAPPEAAATLNQLAATAALTVRFEVAGGANLEPAGAGLDAAIASLFGIIVTAMQRGEWTRLKACREHTCQWAFYDASKNHSGTWCVMSVCGNRNKVRAYQQRRRAATKQT